MQKTQLWQDANAGGAPSIRCEKCGAPVNPNESFCMSCGYPVGKPKEPDNVAPTQCDHCGAPINPGDLFCINCGYAISQPQSTKPAKDEGNKPEVKLCLGCGEPIIPGNKFCIICGRPVVQVDEPAIPDPVDTERPSDSVPPLYGPPPIPVPEPPVSGVEDEEPVGFCTECGSPLFKGDVFCTQCATPVDQSPQEPHIETHGSGHDRPREEEQTITRIPVRPHEPEPPRQDEDDDDPTVRSQLMAITVDEARNGCQKTLRLSDGVEVQVDVPAGANPGTKVDIPGMGLEDKRTGRRGPLRVSFYIMR